MKPAGDLAFDDAVRSYAAACRARIPGFVARHFGWRGSLRLHRSAIGLDLLRAPLNVLLVGPTLFLRLAGLACGGSAGGALGRLAGARATCSSRPISRAGWPIWC